MSIATNPGLRPELASVVSAELRPDEELWYAASPVPDSVARSYRFTTCLGGCLTTLALTVAVFSILYILYAPAPAQGPDHRWSDVGLDIAPFAVLCLVLGIANLMIPGFLRRAAARTAYCITSQRAIIIKIGRVTNVSSYGPDRLVDVIKKIRPDGTGDLRFIQLSPGPSQTRNGSPENAGLSTSLLGGFSRVPDIEACEAAVLALRATTRSASDRQTEA